MRGQGVASELSQTAFEYAKQNNLRVDVICPLAANFLSKHPEYDSILGRKADR
jgi:predicted GNAT family acetyltransferase